MPKSRTSLFSSCNRCRARKVKCSGGVACQSCLKTATYRHRDLSTVVCSYSDDKLCTEDKSLDQSNRLLVSRGKKTADTTTKMDRPTRNRKPYPRVDSPLISESNYPASPDDSNVDQVQEEEVSDIESISDLDSSPSEPPSPTFSYPNFSPMVQTDFRAAQLLFSSFLASTPESSSTSSSSIDTLPYQERNRQYYQTQPQPHYYAYSTPQNLPFYPTYEQYNMYQDYSSSLPTASSSVSNTSNRQHNQYYPSTHMSSSSRNIDTSTTGF